MDSPLVTVICLCYNHERFVNEAILSVINQTYSFIEIIVVDDASTDGSVAQILNLKQLYPQINTLFFNANQGNCKAFNAALKQAKGKYIIDFATDDVMFHTRIEEQVHFFESRSENVGVIFSNASIIDEMGKELYLHVNSENENGVPDGDVFVDVLKKYFICPPTMMFKKSTIDDLGGYDENLAYEDFDFWVRSSRKYHYAYQNFISTKRRLVTHSHSSGFATSSQMTRATLLVCEKALALCRDMDDFEALRFRVNHELGYAFRHKHWIVVLQYRSLLNHLDLLTPKNRIILILAKFFQSIF